MTPRVIVVGPVPPPVHGVTTSTSLVLHNRLLSQRFSVEHLDTSDHRTGVNIGRWDLKNLELGARAAARLSHSLGQPRGVLYLPLSQSSGGFLRDSLFIMCAAVRGWKVAAHLRGGEFPVFYNRQPALMRRWIRATLERVTSLAVMGSALRNLLDGLIPPERIAVVPNGTPDIYEDGVPRQAETVLYLSNFMARKGVLESVDTALRVIRRRPTAQFLFVGEWFDERLKQEACLRARAADGSIRFLPPALGEEKRRLLLSSSLLLFPPVEPEGHPRVVLEAIAAGLPVVTTNRGAIPETVIDGQGGFVLDEADPDQLADRVFQLLEDARLRDRMGKAARTHYLSGFTQEVADRKLADWLSDVASAETLPAHVARIAER